MVRKETVISTDNRKFPKEKEKYTSPLNKEIINYTEDNLPQVEMPDTEYFDFSILKDRHSKYTIEEKFKAVMAYVTTGSAQIASQVSRVPSGTILDWKNKTSWWPIVATYCRKMKNEELDGMLTQAMHLCVDIALKQLKEGEQQVIYNKETKSYETIKIPVQMHKAVQAFSTLWEKRNLQRGEYLSKNPNEEETVMKQLDLLKSQFEKFAKEQKSKGNNILTIQTVETIEDISS